MDFLLNDSNFGPPKSYTSDKIIFSPVMFRNANKLFKIYYSQWSPYYCSNSVWRTDLEGTFPHLLLLFWKGVDEGIVSQDGEDQVWFSPPSSLQQEPQSTTPAHSCSDRKGIQFWGNTLLNFFLVFNLKSTSCIFLWLVDSSQMPHFLWPTKMAPILLRYG